MTEAPCTYIVQTESTRSLLRAVLIQENANTRFVVAHASRTLTLVEAQSSVFELDCRAVSYAEEVFLPLLRNAPFHLECDNAVLIRCFSD